MEREILAADTDNVSHTVAISTSGEALFKENCQKIDVEVRRWIFLYRPCGDFKPFLRKLSKTVQNVLSWEECIELRRRKCDGYPL